MSTEWCQKENKCIDWLGMGSITKDYPKRVTCPDCKKRYKTFIRECDDAGCWHLYMPKHKFKKKIKKQKTKHERHRGM